MDAIRQMKERRAAGAAQGPRAAGDFWGDFAHRAQGASREPYASSAPVHAARAGAVAVLLLAVAGGVRFLLPSPAPMTARAVVQSLDVSAPHDSVFIMSDEATGGTIIWIGGMNPGALNGG